MKKLLVLSDIHANYPALKAIENHVDPDRFDRIVNAGDLTVYSTFPNETIEWFRRRTTSVCIAGNTDKRVLAILEGKPLVKPKMEEKFQEWDEFLQEPGTDVPTAPDAALPIRDVAQRRIRKKYERILKEGTRVLEDPKGEGLHLLRIECKELRYLLEFFSRLFPRRKIRVLIEQLQKLQDLLGSYNDLCVQEQYLLDVAREFRKIGRQSKKTPLAIGSLVGTLNREKQTLQGAFAKTFAEYASPVNQKSFRALFPSDR